MTPGSLLLGAALLVVVLLIILRPFFLPEKTATATADAAPLPSDRHSLRLQKDALLDEIRALDFDLATGKIPEDVHAAERALRVAAAADLLAQIDALPGPADTLTDPDPAVVAAIEAAVAQRRDAARRARPAPAHFCPQCGQSVLPADRFCAYCGTPLATVDVPA